MSNVLARPQLLPRVSFFVPRGNRLCNNSIKISVPRVAEFRRKFDTRPSPFERNASPISSVIPLPRDLLCAPSDYNVFATNSLSGRQLSALYNDRANVLSTSNIFALVAFSDCLRDCGKVVKLGEYRNIFSQSSKIYLKTKCRLSN